MRRILDSLSSKIKAKPFEKEAELIRDKIRINTPESVIEGMLIFFDCLKKWKPANNLFHDTFYQEILKCLQGTLNYIKFVVTKDERFFSGFRSHEEILFNMERLGFQTTGNIQDGGNISIKGMDKGTGSFHFYIDCGSTIIGSNQKEKADQIVINFKKKIPPMLRHLLEFEALDRDGAFLKINS
ncbi:MAG: hypothetical protein ACI86H_001143 [bacterium]|jgi:hypothetical protein